MDSLMANTSTIKNGMLACALLLAVHAHAQQVPMVDQIVDPPLPPGATLVAPESAGVPSLPPSVLQTSDPAYLPPPSADMGTTGIVPGVHTPAAIGSSIAPEVMQTSFVGCTSCGSVGCTGCAEYGPGFARPSGLGVWVRADYLVWYEKKSDSIPLVTSSSLAGAAGFDPSTLPTDFMTIGAADTTVLFGDESFGDNPLEGYRIEVGAWLDSGATLGIMGRYFDAGSRLMTFRSEPGQFNFLGIPYFDDSIGLENNENIHLLNGREGEVDIDIYGDVKSWEVLVRKFAQSGSNYRLDWLYGYRNFALDDSLQLTAASRVTAASEGVVDTVTQIQDQFDVENQFHGVDLGITGHSHEGCWSLDFLVKVAFGVMEQEVDVSGSRVSAIVPSNGSPIIGPVNNVGGLFSQESNIGQNDDSKFAVIPEIDLNLGYGITPNLDITVGYTFIWVSNALRAAQSIDRTVHEGFILDVVPLDSNRPQVSFDDDDYFIHGLNLGVTGRF